jgi:UDPglucose--hexose-1-phosphate uridylyltransferase
MVPEFRKDSTTGQCVIISTERAKRPQLLNDSLSPDIVSCPFCPGNENQTPPEVLAYREPKTEANAPGWQVRVVSNKYPAVVAGEPRAPRSGRFYESSAALGVHEVIIEAPDHTLDIACLKEAQIAAVLCAYRDRILELKKDGRWRYVLIYKNQGGPAGATLEHCHSQLIALPTVPKKVVEEIDGAHGYFDSTGRCPYCDIVQQERSERKRWVSESDHFIVLCPYASRFPYEIWILPKFHSPCFESIGSNECGELAGCLKETLIRLNRRLTNPSLNYIIHSTPLDGSAADYYDWHLEILPKVTQVAGFEWGSGSFINPVAPENAARLLRETIA